MKLIINNQTTDFSAHSLCLMDILQQLNITETKGIAFAINNKIIQKSDWATAILTENDRITLIRATQGG